MIVSLVTVTLWQFKLLLILSWSLINPKSQHLNVDKDFNLMSALVSRLALYALIQSSPSVGRVKQKKNSTDLWSCSHCSRKLQILWSRVGETIAWMQPSKCGSLCSASLTWDILCKKSNGDNSMQAFLRSCDLSIRTSENRGCTIASFTFSKSPDRELDLIL